MSSDVKSGGRNSWTTVWAWVGALVVGMIVVGYMMRPHPAAAHSSHPIFTPPAQLATAVGGQGMTPGSAATPPTTQPTAAGGTSDEAQPVSFQFLGDFKYDPPGPAPGTSEISSTLDPAKTADAASEAAGATGPVIPAKVRALDGKKVGIQGFMIPLDMDSGRTHQFALVAVIPGCFYCQPPALNQYVMVTMKEGKSALYPGPAPVVVTGKLSVGEHREGDMVDSIYRMEAEDVLEGAADPGDVAKQTQF